MLKPQPNKVKGKTNTTVYKNNLNSYLYQIDLVQTSGDLQLQKVQNRLDTIQKDFFNHSVTQIIKCYQQVLSLIPLHNSHTNQPIFNKIIINLNKIAMNCLERQKIEDSYALLEKAKHELEGQQDPNSESLLVLVYNNFGCILLKMKDYQKALVILGKAQSMLMKERESVDRYSGMTYLNISIIYRQLVQYEKSHRHAVKAIQAMHTLYQQTPLPSTSTSTSNSNNDYNIFIIDFIIHLALAYNNCARLEHSMKNFSNAYLLYNHSYFLSRKYLGFSNILTYNFDQDFKKFIHKLEHLQKVTKQKLGFNSKVDLNYQQKDLINITYAQVLQIDNFNEKCLTLQPLDINEIETQRKNHYKNNHSNKTNSFNKIHIDNNANTVNLNNIDYNSNNTNQITNIHTYNNNNVNINSNKNNKSEQSQSIQNNSGNKTVIENNVNSIDIKESKYKINICITQNNEKNINNSKINNDNNYVININQYENENINSIIKQNTMNGSNSVKLLNNSNKENLVSINSYKEKGKSGSLSQIRYFDQLDMSGQQGKSEETELEDLMKSEEEDMGEQEAAALIIQSCWRAKKIDDQALGDMLINFKDNRLEMVYTLKNNQQLTHSFCFANQQALLQQELVQSFMNYVITNLKITGHTHLVLQNLEGSSEKQVIELEVNEERKQLLLSKENNSITRVDLLDNNQPHLVTQLFHT